VRISDWSSDVCSSDLVAGVEKRFGGIRAVQEVDLAVSSGQIHALIGPNGSGKTTTFNLMSGLYLPDGGTVRRNGRDIGGLPAHAITRRGLARSFQITNLFEGLSIYENLRLSLQARHRGHFDPWHDVDSYGEVHRETAELMKFLRSEEHTSELQSLMRISYAVFCLKKKKKTN